jgi:Sec7-like guanine-nucleotide exchange factor
VQIDKIARTRLVKNEMLKASIKFNLKPKNGIAYLIQKGFIQKDPEE